MRAGSCAHRSRFGETVALLGAAAGIALPRMPLNLPPRIPRYPFIPATTAIKPRNITIPHADASSDSRLKANGAAATSTHTSATTLLALACLRLSGATTTVNASEANVAASTAGFDLADNATPTP